MTTKHTPLPIKVDDDNYLVITNDNGTVTICEVHDHSDISTGWHRGISEANADLIVRAVNSHSQLVEALKIIERISLTPPRRESDRVITRIAQTALNAAKDARGDA